MLAPAPDAPPPSAHVRRYKMSGDRYPMGNGSGPTFYLRRFISSMQEEVIEGRLSVGETRYPLRKRLLCRRNPTQSGEYEFVAEELGSFFFGRGVSPTEARQDWLDRVHADFQRLFRTRPFEMTEDDAAKWDKLRSVIDVALYRRTTPITERQIGYVDQARPLPKRIAWIDGQKDRVSFDQMPPEFAAMKAGQWFEASVQRNPVTRELIRVVDLRRISTIHSMSSEQREEFWNSLPKARLEPADDVDWTKPV